MRQEWTTIPSKSSNEWFPLFLESNQLVKRRGEVTERKHGPLPTVWRCVATINIKIILLFPKIYTISCLQKGFHVGGFETRLKAECKKILLLQQTRHRAKTVLAHFKQNKWICCRLCFQIPSLASLQSFMSTQEKTKQKQLQLRVWVTLKKTTFSFISRSWWWWKKNIFKEIQYEIFDKVGFK